jgi:hypothetical protein
LLDGKTLGRRKTVAHLDAAANLKPANSPTRKTQKMPDWLERLDFGTSEKLLRDQ